MWKKLKDLFAPAPLATGNYLNLTPQELNALRELSISPEYRIWQEALDRRSILVSEKLLTAGDAFRLAQLQGTLLGLRLAGTLVDEALQQETNAANERSRQPHKRDRDAALRNTAYGTPAWPNQR